MIDSAAGVWVCPASPANLEKTIANRFNGEYSWALNGTARGRGLFNRMRIGDVCIFGNMHTGFNHFGIVSEKRITDDHDEWPFASPSNTKWRHVFFFKDIHKCHITPEMARRLRGWTSVHQAWQTQTLLRPEHRDAFLDAIIHGGLFQPAKK